MSFVKDSQLGLRISASDKELLRAASDNRGVTMTAFVKGEAVEAAKRELADRESFFLTAEQLADWEKLNSVPAKEIEGLADLMVRKSPFVD